MHFAARILPRGGLPSTPDGSGAMESAKENGPPTTQMKGTSGPANKTVLDSQREFRMRQIQLAAGKLGTDLTVPKRLRSRSPKRESQEDSQEFAAAFLVDDKAKL